MRSPLPDYLLEVVDACASDRSGALADYIPDLARADPERLGVALSTIDGEVYAAGDVDVEFTIQSISKPFVYALAIQDSGLDEVLRRISVEPSGNAFNELSLEAGTGRPYNPMINAGAIASHALVVDGLSSEDERVERVLEAFSELAGRELHVNEAVFESEMSTAHRNLGIAHMLRAQGIIEDDPEEIVRGYTRQCSIDVTARDLALMSATLANSGRQPQSGRRIIDPRVVRQVLSVMLSCGMYDAAGDWITTVGIPAKSGVSGGVIGALPGQLGLAVFSPRLDEHGNSVRGVQVCERLSADTGLHLMESVQPARSIMSAPEVDIDGDGARTVTVRLRGSMLFTGAERVLRALSQLDTGDLGRLVVDLEDVFTMSDVAVRMLVEASRRVALDGVSVTVHDPGELLGDVSADALGAAVVVDEPLAAG